MKGTLHFIGEAEAAIAARVHCFRRQGARLALGIALGVPSLYAIPTINERVALPDVSVAGNYGTAMFSAAVPTENAVTLKSRVTVLVLETGFLMGTTTAVHELGHARRVRAAGGNSQWETGDVNWWSYWAHRDPLASGATRWQVPYSTSLDQKISILAGGFNATTAWDESAAGSGPFGLVSARYSTLFYELAGVKSDTDDLDQISQAYRLKGYRIARRELQFWQLLAGGVSQTNHVVKTYAYYTPDGVSVRALTRWNDWSLAAEAVVHGRRTVELEVGRRMNLGNNIELFPKLLVSARGLGGSLKAEAHFGQTRLSMNVQLVNPATLLGSRANTSFDLQVTRLL